MPELRLAVLTIAFAAGIVAAAAFSAAGCVVFAIVAGAVAVAALPSHRRAALPIVAAAFALGALRYGLDRQVPPKDISHFTARISEFEGAVASDPEPGSDRTRLLLRADRAKMPDGWKPVAGFVSVSIYEEAEDAPKLEYGERARFEVRPYVPSEPTNPGQFSYREYLARQGIYACASVRDGSRVRALPGGKGNAVVTAALAAKHYVERCIQRLHPPEVASLVIGIVLGTYSYLPPETMKAFTDTGTLHVLAASGYNCFIVVVLTTPVLRFMRLMPRWRCAVIIALLGMYLMMVGPKPSLVRASIMAGLLLLATPLGRTAHTRNLFFAAGLIVLAVNPADIFDVGFQLSFLAVWALIWVSPLIEVLIRTGGPAADPERGQIARWWLRKGAGYAVGSAVATAAVTLVTAPVIAYNFNYFSLTSIPANVVVALGVPVIVADGLVSTVTVHAGVLGRLLAGLGGAATRAVLDAVGFLASWRYSAVGVASPAAGAIAGYYTLLYAALAFARSRRAAR